MARLPPAAVPRHLTPRYVRLTAQPWPATTQRQRLCSRTFARQNKARLPAESRDPSFDPTIRRGTPDPCPACLISMLIPRRGTELGDRRQDAQQTSMIASHAESAGSLRSEAADTLRYGHWLRLSREIRRSGRLVSGRSDRHIEQRRMFCAVADWSAERSAVVHRGVSSRQPPVLNLSGIGIYAPLPHRGPRDIGSADDEAGWCGWGPWRGPARRPGVLPF